MLDDERSALRRKYLPFILTIVVGATLGVWHNAAVSRGASSPFTNAARTILSPAIRAVGGVADWFSGTGRWLVNSRSLARENVRLRRELARLRAEAQELREAAITARRLEQEIGFLTEPTPRRLPARVVAMTPAPHVATVVIDRGKRDGLRNGSIVLAPEGVLGHAVDVAYSTSVVLIASDPRCALGAMVQRSESRAIGICRGLGRGMLRMSYLSRDAEISTGDVIVTSGLGGSGGIYPKGLVIGSVTRVTDDAATSSKVAIVRQAASVHRLEEVAVLR
ncbi:MAG: rod shape-determining protein MreC [Chthonomonadales bacterium]|nr:rod shape-determining protein MreC [Chthonomonadales bacterium]